MDIIGPAFFQSLKFVKSAESIDGDIFIEKAFLF
jgi:hypothetical protein